LGLLQEALELSETLAPLEVKLRQARKEGLITSDYLGHQIGEAERAGVINKHETADLQAYHEKVQHLLSVDDFSPDELGHPGYRDKIVAVDEKSAAEPAPKRAASSKISKKKVAKKKAASKKSTAKKASRKKKA
jgi:acyl-CoA dehydrogenase